MEDALRRIQRRCLAVRQACRQGSAGNREVRALTLSIVNIRRMETSLRREVAENLTQSLSELRREIAQSSSGTQTLVSFSLPRISRRGSCGRPSLDVQREQLQMLMQQGFSIRQMAQMLNCSSSYLYRRTRVLGISARSRFSNITDADLEQQVQRLHLLYPRAGSEIMRGLLLAEGITVPRRRVRETLNRVDPISVAYRWSSTVARRTYHVPFPNSLWHIDAHMRLIRWGIVTHGGIDGHSRLITFLNCGFNNRAVTVLFHFLRATCRYGVPARVRSDHGGENTLVALFMNLLHGEESRSHITGLSVHNQRIERLWRDVFHQVIYTFYNLFYTWEDLHILDPENDIHRLSLQMVVVPEIQRRLDLFRSAWNNHRLRTENNQSPSQLWVQGMLNNVDANTTAINNVFGDDPYREENLEAVLGRHGIHLDQLHADDEELQRAVSVPRLRLNLTPTQQQTVQNAITGIVDVQLRFETCCREIANQLSAP